MQPNGIITILKLQKKQIENYEDMVNKERKIKSLKEIGTKEFKNWNGKC